jgi:hypothetical protein
MAVDGKYGRVTLERGTIGEDEPVVVFRAQDRLLPLLLGVYLELCRAFGSGEFHRQVVIERQAEVAAWQMSHVTKVPDTTREQMGR